MKKALFIFCICQLITYLAFSQVKLKPKPIPYGNNPAAGRYYDIRGFRMYCEVYGKGKPLLMIHGNGGDITAFSHNIPYFSKKYMVIVADSRAQGKSIDEKDSLSFEMMADDFSALLTAMHIDSSYVIGWSDGAINALLLAMRHPDKVKRLASTGANLRPDSLGIEPEVWKDEEKEFNSYKYKLLITEKQKYNYKMFMLDWEQPHVPLLALRKIKCPSLIICGDHDLIPIKHTVDIYRNIPKAYLWVVPNSPHSTLIDHADDFNKTVDNFFTQPFHNWKQ